MDATPSRAGYVYLVTCPYQVHCKIGRWSGTLPQLKSRYAAYYDTPNILTLWCDDAMATEKRLKVAVKQAGLTTAKGGLVECSAKMRSFFMAIVGASDSLTETLVDVPGLFTLKPLDE